FALALTKCPSLANIIKITVRMAIGTLLFLGLTAPLWLSFLSALEGTYSRHAGVKVSQLPFATLIEAFDDIFALLWHRWDAFRAPGASILVTVGCIFAAVRWRELKRQPFFWINGLAIVLWAGCAFGVVPHKLLEHVPLLNRTHHVYTEFSYLIVLHVTIGCA